MTMTSSPFVLTAIGTIRGRVSRRELCLSKVEEELASLLDKHQILRDATFNSISVIIHLGEAHIPPRVWRVDKRHGVLEAAIGVPFAAVRRRDAEHVCDVMRRAALEALIAACQSHGLPADGITAAIDNPPGSSAL